MKCANEEGIRLRGIYIHSDDKDKISLPTELAGKKVVYCTWANIKSFMS